MPVLSSHMRFWRLPFAGCRLRLVAFLLGLTAASSIGPSRIWGQEAPTEGNDTTPTDTGLLVAHAGLRVELLGVPVPGGSFRIRFGRIAVLSAQVGIQPIAWTVQYDDDLRLDLLFNARLQVGLSDQWNRFELGLFVEAAKGVIVLDRCCDPTYEVKQIGLEMGMASGRFTYFGDVSIGISNRSSPHLFAQLGIGVRYRLSSPS